MQRADLSFQEIFNSLLAGNKLVLHFPDETSAETFRTRLHHHKSRQEKLFLGIGLTVEDEKTVLQFRAKKGDTLEDGVAAYVQFVLPSPLKKYPVMIVEEQDLKNGNAEISTAVG